MSRRIGGVALLAIAALMMVGFANSSLPIAAPNVIVALLLVVIAPAVGGAMLLRAPRGDSARLRVLRQQAIEGEILRLAMAQRGRLTATEVATAIALSPEEAKAALDALVAREVADLAVSDAGVLVYTFHEARHLGGKHEARGLLDG